MRIKGWGCGWSLTAPEWAGLCPWLQSFRDSCSQWESPHFLHILWLQRFAASSLLLSHWNVTAPLQDSHWGAGRSCTSIFLLDTEFLFAFMPHNSFQCEKPHKCLLPVSFPTHIHSQPFSPHGTEESAVNAEFPQNGAMRSEWLKQRLCWRLLETCALESLLRFVKDKNQGFEFM